MDAKDKSQLPTTDLNIFEMTSHGNYHENVLIEDQSSFNIFLKLNTTFGELLAVDFFMYTIARKFSRELVHTSYH